MTTKEEETLLVILTIDEKLDTELTKKRYVDVLQGRQAELVTLTDLEDRCLVGGSLKYYSGGRMYRFSRPSKEEWCLSRGTELS